MYKCSLEAHVWVPFILVKQFYAIKMFAVFWMQNQTLLSQVKCHASAHHKHSLKPHGITSLSKTESSFRVKERKWSHLVLYGSLRPCGLYSPWNSLLSPWNSSGQNTLVGSLSLLQWIFQTQESNRGLLHCRQILYQLEESN